MVVGVVGVVDDFDFVVIQVWQYGGYFIQNCVVFGCECSVVGFKFDDVVGQCLVQQFLFGYCCYVQFVFDCVVLVECCCYVVCELLLLCFVIDVVVQGNLCVVDVELFMVDLFDGW